MFYNQRVFKNDRLDQRLFGSHTQIVRSPVIPASYQATQQKSSQRSIYSGLLTSLPWGIAMLSALAIFGLGG